MAVHLYSFAMTKPSEPERLYSVKQVAELGLIPYSAEHIRMLCRKGPTYGGLRSVRGSARGHYKIPASAIEEWKKRNEYLPWAR